MNDLAVPVTGAPPTRGKLEATVIISPDADLSRTWFRDRKVCEVAPGSTLGDFGVLVKTPKQLQLR